MKNPAFPLKRPDILQSAFASFATIAALALLGWVLAYWTWQWFSPQAELRVQEAAKPAGRIESAGGIFGRLQQESVSIGNNIKLIGVISSASGGSGYAVMQFSEQPARPVREGEAIAPGLRLAEVHPDKVVIEHGGMLETIALPRRKK